MNDAMQEFARSEIKSGLEKCSDAQRLLFRRMYSPDDLEKGMDSVVDEMPAEKLDWAMDQVRSTLEKMS